MLSASLYITLCSARNRVLVRLRRLREPRYLIGAVVGVAYLYFAVIARFGQGRPGRRRVGNDGASPFEAMAPFQMAGTALAGLGVFLYAVAAWVLPSKSGLLEFSEAETAILVPAPVSRRQLLIHRVMRSQVGSLIASAFIALFAAPFGGVARLRLAVSMWVLLVTIRVYYGAVALTKARLRSPVASVRRAAWLPIGLFVAAALVVAAGIAAQLRPLPASASDFWVHLARAASTGAVHVVLWPFIAVLRPPFATTVPAYVGALAASLAVLAVTTVWMLLNDVALDEALGDRVERQTETAPRARMPRVRETPWTLAPAGRLELAFFWKGATQTFRALNLPKARYLPPIIAITFAAFGAAMGVANGSNVRGPVAFVMALSCILAGLATLFGPQMLRADLRTDFEHLDLIKTWPVRAGDVIRGEMAWPTAIVSATACAALLVAAFASGAAVANVPFVDRWLVAIALMLGAPALIAAQYAVHNAVTIAFPAWVPLGKQRTRGIDAMGQRLILLAAILVSLVLFALPGAIGAGAVWLIFHRLAGSVVFVGMAIVFSAIVLTEVIVVTELLGPAYERIDVTSIERPE